MTADLPASSSSAKSPSGAGQILSLLRQEPSRTRAELVELTGFARSTINARLETLITHGLVVAAGARQSTGGRRPVAVAFNPRAGVVLAADLGATHARLAVTDLSGEILAERTEDIQIAAGPDSLLGWVQDAFDDLLGEAGKERADVRGIGMGLPGPVEFSTGRPVAPPIMPGWDDFDVPGYFHDRYAVPVVVDNDVNIMAISEHQRRHPSVRDLLYVKLGTGIGCGIVSEGKAHRGAQGAAGDIGHIRLPGYDGVVCRCGNTGCLEAVAGGSALASSLAEAGFPAQNARDVVRHLKEGQLEAVQVVRKAGRDIGTVLAGAVNLFNPDTIVIGGDLAEADETLMAGIREIIYQRSTPLATRSLNIARADPDHRAGVVGAALLVLDQILDPEIVDRNLAALIAA